MTIDDYLQIYDLLRAEYEQETARRFVVSHAEFDPPYIATIEREGRIAGVAFSWQINDPLDVEIKPGYPGDQPGGRYIYWPLIYIDPKHRGVGAWIELLVRSVEICPGAERLAYHRDGELEIHSIPELLKEHAGANDGTKGRAIHGTGAADVRGDPGQGPVPGGDGPKRREPPVGQGAPWESQEEDHEAVAAEDSGREGYKAF